ncbi:MAG: hypothetical protein JST49_12515 [Bacteroidetes bacterium]|nr:hypothetical protein [Bacteroidota bacterium]
MSFNGTEGTIITLADGATMTAAYRATMPSGGRLGIFFGKDKLNSLLSQTGAKGIRFYFALDSNGAQQLVCVAANSSENDMTSLVLDAGYPCPTYCSTKNVLNSDPSTCEEEEENV